MNGDEFKEYLDLWSMRLDMASKNSGMERVRELLLECLITYGGNSNKELYSKEQIIDILRDWEFTNPELTSDGHGEFPDSYSLTEKNLESLKKLL